jgi:hypothetical protein
MRTIFKTIITIISQRSLLLLLVSSFVTSAQTPSAPKAIQIIMRVDPSDTTMHKGDLNFKANTKVIGTAVIALKDTVNIYKVHLKVGTTDSTGNLLTKSFLFSQCGDFIDGTSFYKKGNALYIGLGMFTGINLYFGEVKLESNQNTFTPATKFKSRINN